MNDLRLQLIGKLDINATVKDVNEKLQAIEKKINKLKLNIEFSKDAEKRIEDLHKKLKDVNSVSFDNKMFDSMQKQLDKARGEAKKFKDELDSINKGNANSPEGSYIPLPDKKDIEKEAKKIKLTFEELIKKLKDDGFEYQIKFDVDDKGSKKAQQVIASIKNDIGEIQKITFKPNTEGQFENVQELFKNTDPSIINNYNKALDDYNNRLKEIERSGRASETVMKSFREEFEYLKQNPTLPLIRKTQELEGSLKALNSAFSYDEHVYKMSKAMKDASDKVDDLRNKLERTKNSYKGTVDTIRANEISKEIEKLEMEKPKFNSNADIDKFSAQVKALSNSISGLGAEATKARASSLGLFGSMAVAMQRFPVNNSGGNETL